MKKKKLKRLLAEAREDLQDAVVWGNKVDEQLQELKLQLGRKNKVLEAMTRLLGIGM